VTAGKIQPKKLRLDSFDSETHDDIILEDTIEENKQE
jgi:hypothetical protein